MKALALLLLLAGSAHATGSLITGGNTGGSSSGGSPSFSTVTITGNSAGCLVVGTTALYVDCANKRVGIGTGTPNVPLEIQSSVLNGTKLRLDGSQYSGAQNIKIEFNASGSDGFTQEYGRINVLTDPTGSELGILTIGANAGGANSPLSVTNGRVGVGANNTAPATTLDVAGNAQFGSGVTRSTFSTTGALTMASGASINIPNSGSGASTMLSLTNTGTASADRGSSLTWNGDSSPTTQFSLQSGWDGAATTDAYALLNVRGSSANTTRMKWASNGSVIYSPGLTTTSTVTATGNASFAGILGQKSQISCATGLTTDSAGLINGCVASDWKLKTAVKALEYVPGSIDLLRPVSYRWKAHVSKDTREHIGFIAQEVEKVYPAAVVAAGKDVKGIDSNAMVAALVLEVQALRKRVAALEAK